MILDAGICTVFQKQDTAQPGGMPQISYTRKACGWYGVRSFSSAPDWVRNVKEGATVALSIRMHQNLSITTRDAIVLMDVGTPPASAPLYEVLRVYHGTDDATGQPITDIDLEVVEA